MQKYIKASQGSKLLSVFWLMNGRFVGAIDTLNGDSVVQYGDFLQIDKDHYDIWKNYSDGKPYDYYPRGRIMFNIKIHKFIVVCDKKINNSITRREMLLQYYGLPETTIFEQDEHYKSNEVY